MTHVNEITLKFMLVTQIHIAVVIVYLRPTDTL